MSVWQDRQKGSCPRQKKIKKRAEEWGYIEEARDSLFGIEGEASRIYFQALSNVLPEAVYSGTRTKRPPGDLFNAMLSYGYGILYTEVEKACILSGLNPTWVSCIPTCRESLPSSLT